MNFARKENIMNPYIQAEHNALVGYAKTLGYTCGVGGHICRPNGGHVAHGWEKAINVLGFSLRKRAVIDATTFDSITEFRRAIERGYRVRFAGGAQTAAERVIEQVAARMESDEALCA